MGTQVLILPIMERRSFNVNRNIYIVNHSNNNKNEKKKEKKKKKSTYKHLHFFLNPFLPVMKTRTVNIPAQKFNKHSYTKDSAEHDFICQSGSYASLP